LRRFFKEKWVSAHSIQTGAAQPVQQSLSLCGEHLVSWAERG
jgi:hypothetical protein